MPSDTGRSIFKSLATTGFSQTDENPRDRRIFYPAFAILLSWRARAKSARILRRLVYG